MLKVCQECEIELLQLALQLVDIDLRRLSSYFSASH